MYREVLRNRNYQKSLAADAVNRFGDGIDTIAFTWLTYTATQSASLSALVFGANMLPTVIFQPLAAPVIDKMKKKSVMMWTDWLRGICLGGFICLLLNDLMAPWMFVAFTFLINTIEAFRVPAGVAFLPKFLEGEQLGQGINCNRMVSQISQLAGTAAGGALTAISPVLAMGIDLATFLLSGILIAWMDVKETIDHVTLSNDYGTNLKEGFRYLGKNKAFCTFMITVLLFNMLACVFSALSAPYVSGVLNASPGYLSSANMIVTICSLVMLWVYPKVSKFLKPSVIVTWIAFGITGVIYLALAFLPRLQGPERMIAWVVLFLLMGGSAGIFGAFTNIIFVKVVDEAYLARAVGIFNSAVSLVMPLISLLVARVVPFMGIPLLMGAAGGLSFGILLIFQWGKNCKILDDMEQRG